MKHLTIFRCMVLAFSFLWVAQAQAQTNDPVVMGYYANWDMYNTNLPNAAKNLTFNSHETQDKLARLNTIAYAFFGTAPDGSLQSFDYWSDFSTEDAAFCAANPTICFKDGDGDVTGGVGNFRAFAYSGDVNGVTNRLLAVGGATHDAVIENAMNHPENFINSLKTLRASYPFNGLDLDYEPIGGIPAEYKQKFIDLVSAIRSAMGEDFMITYTIISDQKAIDEFGASNWAKLSSLVDYVNVMGYDMTGDWESLTGLQSSLYLIPNTGGSERYSDDTTVTALLNNGVAANKIILGFPMYAIALAHAAADGLGQSFSGLYEGVNTLQPGRMAYRQLIDNNYPIKNYIQNGTILGAYNNFISPASGNVFTTFDSVDSVKAKVNYAKSTQLGGVMMWDINYDVPAVDAEGQNNATSLINAVNEVYGIDARPSPETAYFILQITNTGPDVAGPNAYASATLVVDGGYYVFGNEWSNPISPKLSTVWGTEASSEKVEGVNNNETLDTFFAGDADSFTTSQILINGYSSYESDLNYPNNQYDCNLGRNYTFEAGHSYHLMLNAANQSCAISMLN